MLAKVAEILTLIASASIQWVFYRKRLPKDFKPSRILVVKLDHIGDIILSTPVFSNLRQTYPNTELHALTGSWSSVILKHHPDVDKVIKYNSPAFSRNNQPTSFMNAIRIFRQLRKNKYDLLIELRSDWRIVLFALFRVSKRRIDRASIQITNKLGFKQFSGIHETTRNLDVLNRSNISTPIQTTTFYVTDQVKNWTDQFFEQNNIDRRLPLVSIHPGSPIILKRWLPERYAEVADWLISQAQTQICFVGVKDEIPIIKKIQNRMHGNSILMADKTDIPQLAAILKRCSLFIGNDSGPMHLAAAVGIPAIGLFGPGDPKRFAPVGEKCQIIQKKNDCPPCKGTICKYFENGCMSKIQVDDVIKAIKKYEFFT